MPVSDGMCHALGGALKYPKSFGVFFLGKRQFLKKKNNQQTKRKR